MEERVKVGNNEKREQTVMSTVATSHTNLKKSGRTVQDLAKYVTGPSSTFSTKKPLRIPTLYTCVRPTVSREEIRSRLVQMLVKIKRIRRRRNSALLRLVRSCSTQHCRKITKKVQ